MRSAGSATEKRDRAHWRTSPGAFHISKFNLHDNGSGGAAYLDFYEPGSSAVYTSCYFTANGSCVLKPPVGGTWKATLDPVGGSVGSLTLTMG